MAAMILLKLSSSCNHCLICSFSSVIELASFEQSAETKDERYEKCMAPRNEWNEVALLATSTTQSRKNSSRKNFHSQSRIQRDY